MYTTILWGVAIPMHVRIRGGRGARSRACCKALLLVLLCSPPLSSITSIIASDQVLGPTAPQVPDCSREPLPLDADPQYFPTGAFGIDGAFEASINACFLRAMQEAPLPELVTLETAQVFRLTLIPAWRPPFIVRLAVRSDGTGTLAVKAAKSQRNAGVITVGRTEAISKSDVDVFLTLVEAAGFWSMSTKEVYSKDPRVIVQVMDGEKWVIEGAQNGRYHVVTRTSPKPGPYAELTSYLFRRLARLEMPPVPVIPRKRH